MKSSLFSAFRRASLALLLAGCNPIASTYSPAAPTQPPSGTTTLSATETTSTMPAPLDDMPRDPPLLDPAGPEVQSLIEIAKADLAQRLSIAVSQINVRDYRTVLWPDDSLGCPQPGVTYTEVPVPGYLVILESRGKEFEYHANLKNYVFYCENPTPPLEAPP